MWCRTLRVKPLTILMRYRSCKASISSDRGLKLMSPQNHSCSHFNGYPDGMLSVWTGWPSVSILRQGETACFVHSFFHSTAACTPSKQICPWDTLCCWGAQQAQSHTGWERRLRARAKHVWAFWTLGCCFSAEQINGFRPEWCISTIYNAWDTPFWLGTLEIQSHTGWERRLRDRAKHVWAFWTLGCCWGVQQVQSHTGWERPLRDRAKHVWAFWTLGCCWGVQQVQSHTGWERPLRDSMCGPSER